MFVIACFKFLFQDDLLYNLRERVFNTFFLNISKVLNSMF